LKRVTLAIVLLTTACRRDAVTTSNDAAIIDATVVDAAVADTSVVDAATVDASTAPAKPAFRRFDPAAQFIHEARSARGPGGLNDAKDEALSPEQSSKLQAISKKLAATDTPPSDAIAALRDELASGIRAGRLDEPKLKARRADLAKAIEPVMAAERDALDELHRVLMPPQRARATYSAHLGRPFSVNGHVVTNMCRSWTTDLRLPDAKQQQIEAALPSAKGLTVAFDRRIQEIAKAFEKEGFDARKLDSLDPKKKAVLPLDAETEFVRKILPLLDEQAREVVADRVAKEAVGKLRDY
jgi:hypothetical protein